MSQDTNPWLSKPLPRPPKRTSDSVLVREPVGVVGPSSPQPGVPEPPLVDRLPVREQKKQASLWVVGVHGGAGESTLAALDPTWAAGDHGWPQLPSGDRARVVLVARSSMYGLQRAQLAATQWASGLVPHIELLGLVVVADAPGRLPRPLRDFLQVIQGGVPRTWQVPWVDAWRFGEHLDVSDLPRPVHRLVEDLTVIISRGDAELVGSDEKE